MSQILYILSLTVISVFMILLIMIQRGKGGGLAGAFGGMGGQSAFGTKAGDTFTKITIVTALIWFLCCIIVLVCLQGKWGGSRLQLGNDGNPTIPTQSAPAQVPSPTSDPAP